MIDDRPAAAPLQGVRLLVVEDDVLVYMLLEDMLTELGCEIVPATRLTDALALASGETLDGAILDINLRDQLSYPIADELAERRIPFAFVTGYGAVREEYRSRPLLQKPMRDSDVLRVIRGMLCQSAH